MLSSAEVDGTYVDILSRNKHSSSYTTGGGLYLKRRNILAYDVEFDSTVHFILLSSE